MLSSITELEDRVLLPATRTEALITRIFAAAGADGDEANAIAAHLVEATASGHDSHGIIRVPRYLDALDKGHVQFGQTPEPVIDNDSFVLFEGNHGFGQVLARDATMAGIKKAKKQGVALVGLRNAGHIGRIGAWAELACNAGTASIHFVNVGPVLLVAPHGGAERRMATNPVCIGVPNHGGDDFILDFATSRVAEGKILVAQKAGKQVSSEFLIDGAGQPATDPLALYGEVPPGTVPNAMRGTGALTPMGDHKGSGLGLACELLAGALTGSGTTQSGGDKVHNGLLSVFIDPGKLDDGHAWADSVRDYIDFVHACRPSDPASPVMIPGDPERKSREDRQANGIPLDHESWRNILDAGQRYGLERDEMLAIVSA